MSENSSLDFNVREVFQMMQNHKNYLFPANAIDIDNIEHLKMCIIAFADYHNQVCQEHKDEVKELEQIVSEQEAENADYWKAKYEDLKDDIRDLRM